MRKEIKSITEEEFKKLPSKPDLLLGSQKRKTELEEKLKDNQMEEERLEVAYDKIKWDKIVKEYLIKELNNEMFNESKLFEEKGKQLFGMTYRIMKAADWGKQKELKNWKEDWIHKY